MLIQEGHGMDNKKLYAFLKSAEIGSQAAAADALGYTPSAVSQLVSSLEKELGLTLLERSSKGVSVTEEGQGLIPLINDYLAHEQRIYDYAADINGLLTGSLAITAYPSAATNWLPEIVGKFSADHPEIHITIMECIRSDIYQNLDNNTAELGILTYVEPMPYEWIPLADEPMLAVLPEDHPLAASDSYPVAQAAGDKFILTSQGQDVEILNILRRNGVEPEIRYTTYDTPVTLAMVQQGLGVSIVNDLSARRWNDHIVKLPLDPPEKITFGIAFKSYDQLSTAARKFLDYAVKYLTRSEAR